MKYIQNVWHEWYASSVQIVRNVSERYMCAYACVRLDCPLVAVTKKPRIERVEAKGVEPRLSSRDGRVQVRRERGKTREGGS